MKKLLLILFGLLLAVYVSGQATRIYNQDIRINKTTPILDLQGLGAKIYLDGAISGTATLQPPAVAGSTVQTLPSSTGTLINSADTSGMLDTYILDSEARTAVHDTIQAERDNAVLGIAWEDRYDGSTGNDYFYTKDQVDGLLASGGGGVITEKMLQFTVDDADAPSAGDSTIQHSEFLGNVLDVYRDGAYQTINFTATNTKEGYRLNSDIITVNPVFQANEQIIINVKDPVTRSFLALEGTESDLVDSLLVYYKLDETSGTTGDDANDVQDAVLGTGTTPSTLHAKYNYGRHIGYKSQIRVPYNVNVNPDSLFTVSAWIWADSVGTSSADYIFAITNTTTPVLAHRAYLDTDGKIMFRTYNTTGTQYTSISTDAISDSTLYHVVFVHRGNGKTNLIYVNGVDVTTSYDANYTFSGTIQGTNSSIYFGNSATNGTLNFRGYMDECGLWYQAFTQADVTLLYESLVSHPFTE